MLTLLSMPMACAMTASAAGLVQQGRHSPLGWAALAVLSMASSVNRDPTSVRNGNRHLNKYSQYRGLEPGVISRLNNESLSRPVAVQRTQLDQPSELTVLVCYNYNTSGP